MESAPVNDAVEWRYQLHLHLLDDTSQASFTAYTVDDLVKVLLRCWDQRMRRLSSQSHA
jgi:hypothetical protein